MVEQQSHNNHKALKVFLIGLGLFVGVQLLARYMLTTSLVHNFAKAKIESIANEQLSGTLEIGDLKGDLWKELLLTQVSISNEEPILKADTLYVSYNIWSFFKEVYVINAIKGVGIQTNINEGQDSLFNVQKIVSSDPSESETDEEPDPIQLMLNSIELRDINATIFSPSYLPDSVLKVKELSANASFQKTDTLRATLSSLSFLIEEGRLPEAIKVNTSAHVIEDQITLQEMVVETGRSLIKTKAAISLLDSTVSAEASMASLSLADIQPYLDVEIPEDELNLELSVSGSLDSLRIQLNLDNEYVPNLEMVAEVSFNGVPSIHQFGVFGDGLDISHFTNDSLDVQIGEYRFSINGFISEDIPKADLIWGFTFLSLRYENYYMNRVIGSGTLKDDDLIGHLAIHPQFEEQINMYPKMYNISSEKPIWSFAAAFQNLDISYWTEFSDVKTNLNFGINIEGEGFELGDIPWKFSISSRYEMIVKKFDAKAQNLPAIEFLRVSNNIINSQKLEEYVLKGEIDDETVTSKGHIMFDESRIAFELNAVDILEAVPKYDYFVTTNDFDLSEINQTADLPTALNLEIYGEGKGFDPDDCFLLATINLDSSIVNGSAFENLDASIEFNDGVLSISEGVLQSDILEGEFSGRKNVTDKTDPENWLIVDMLVKNIQPLAPLANVELLSARGEIKGRITQDTSNVLRGNMEVDFEDIIVDSLFTASRISGKTDISMSELRRFSLNMSIESPILSNITFQDIELVSEGIANEDTLQSTFNLDIIGSDRGKLVQEGSVSANFNEELVDIRFEQFNFISSESELELQQPFNIRFDQESISTDTLDLRANSGAFLQLSIPYADTIEQYGWFTGENFDFGIIQEVIFGERFIDGVLSGQMFFNRSPEDVTGSGAFDLKRISYQEAVADSLDITFDIRKERLFAEGSISWDQEEKVVGSLNVPFVLKEASELEDAFFEQSVEGSLTVNPSEINQFQTLLSEFGITETDGILSFSGSMSGTAGKPDFEGAFILNEPILSGIRVDTVSAKFNYDNILGGLQIQSEIIAANQKAAEINITYPVQYDFRTFQVILPDDKERITVTAKTEDFNIAVLNDFLNEDYLNELNGTLNADLSLEGTTEKMIPKGFLRLSNAKVSVPIAGITLDGIKSDVEFTESGLNVKEMTAKSGKGNFTANGTIQLEGIIPKTMNLTAKASQFRLANTEDYNLVIDLDSRLTGKAITPKATGKVTVRNGFVYLQDFGENTIEEVQLEGEALSSFSPYDSLEIDMTFEIQRDFYVRNRTYLDMEIELIGSLDAQKDTKGNLSLFGSLTGIKGYVRPLGKTFDMEEADFTFSGPIDNPDLNIRSKYIPPTRQKGESVELFYSIEGTAKDPEFSFESDPYMDEGDIICYAIFNGPCTESWQSLLANSNSLSAKDVLSDVLLDELEALATRQLGVDVVQIDNTGTNGGTSIKTGWYINQRTFFAIINELTGSSPKTLFMLEYIISENWDLIVTQGGDTRRGVDFRFQYDY
ncbi:MAG: hypothetical protein BalsKO_00400 [Balneolaceae bacterium]